MLSSIGQFPGSKNAGILFWFPHLFPYFNGYRRSSATIFCVECERLLEEDYKQRIEDLGMSNAALCDDVAFLRGTVQVQERRIESLQGQIEDMQARNMKNNIVISGITGDNEEESCKDKTIQFLRDNLKMEVQEADVVVAHRLGKKQVGQGSRSIVAKVSNNIRYKVFSHTKNLKSKTNAIGKQYFVDPQLPENIAAERKELYFRKAQAVEKNLKREERHRATIEIKDQQLYINKERQSKKVWPPTATDVLNLDKQEYEEIEAIELLESKGVQDTGSLFKGYAQKIETINCIPDIYKKVKIIHPDADHIVMVYRVGEEEGCCDDGEANAALKLLKLLKNHDEKNIVALVIRRKLGPRIGARRFHHILAQAREALNKVQDAK